MYDYHTFSFVFSHDTNITVIKELFYNLFIFISYLNLAIFTQNLAIFIQNDGVAMESPLGPILAGILIVELENVLVPKLKQHIKYWRRYVDDTFVCVKNGSIEYVSLVLETFHLNIEFTYEKEVNNTLPFLGVLFIRNSDHVYTTVYRNETNNDLYLH